MRSFKIISTVFFLIFLVIGIIFAIGFWNFKKEAVYSAGKIYENVNLAANALKGLETKKAESSLTMIKEELNLWFERFRWSQTIPILKIIPETIKRFRNITDVSIKLTKNLETLKSNGIQYILQQKSDTLIQLLKDIKEQVNALVQQAKDKKLYAANNFLTALISWLDNDEPQHILILFQNSSEIRPGGGFIGSYAHLILKRGGLVNLEVNDIYDTDGQLTINVVPPQPLQAITTKWGARDANWFLDFPTSARKVIKFLEASRIYLDRDIHFSGVIAINDTVIKDILSILGPVEIKTDEITLTLNSENFLSEIQKEVETKANKEILKKVTPALFERLNKIDNDRIKKDLIGLINNKILNKDVMVYFENPIMESFMQTLNVGGEWFQAPAHFIGGYLAVANSNIAGGKTDVLVNQKIKLNSRIEKSGIVENKLIIEREFTKSNLEDKWYNTDNQVFVQIFVTRGSKLISMSGNDLKEIKKPIDYEKEDFIIDPDLEAKKNKTAFEYWTITKPGESRTVELKYSEFLPIDSLEGLDIKGRSRYSFVFDKQSGVNGEIEIQLEAPMGSIWEESGSNIFKYATDRIPARIVLTLNLIAK